ncbi:MAG: hypothetical protein H6924_03830 [Alphaproteobacteria bacterium]|nr:hypothetical protein [Alphaproteobacteria bacterium]
MPVPMPISAHAEFAAISGLGEERSTARWRWPTLLMRCPRRRILPVMMASVWCNHRFRYGRWPRQPSTTATAMIPRQIFGAPVFFLSPALQAGRSYTHRFVTTNFAARRRQVRQNGA